MTDHIAGTSPIDHYRDLLRLLNALGSRPEEPQARQLCYSLATARNEDELAEAMGQARAYLAHDGTSQ